MLKRNRIKCLMLLPVFMTPNTLTPFHNQAWQLIEKQADNKEVVQVNEVGLIKHPIEVQFENKKIENDKKKAEEERLRKEKELEEQKKNEDNNKQIFIVSYYGATSKECGNSHFITSSGVPVAEGQIAVPKEIPFGSKIIIDGIEYIATDRGNPDYIKTLNDGSMKVDIFVPRLESEINNDYKYEKRIAKMGIKKVVGKLYIKEK